jgi:small subunit ribosomal protein S16
VSVKIRLTRLGSRKRPYYRVIAVDSRKKRDGAYIENLGTYHPLEKEDMQVDIKEDRIREWLDKGARPSRTVKILLNKKGIQVK